MMVPRVKNNLSAPGIQQIRLTQFTLKAIVIVCMTLTICFWWLSTNLQDEIDILENQSHKIMAETTQLITQAKTTNIDLSDQAIHKIPQHITFVKQVRERVGFSWTQLLTDLESALPRNISMRAVSLDEKTNTVLLNGSAQSLQDLNELLHRLEKHQAFHDVILAQHAKKKRKETKSQLAIVFSMKVSYGPHHRSSNTHKS